MLSWLTNSRVSLAILAATLAPLAGRAQTLELLPRAQVDRGGVLLDQIFAETNGVAIPKGIRLTAAPTWGKTLVLERKDIAELLAKQAPDFAAAELSGAPQITISRRSRKLEDAELLARMLEKLQPPTNAERTVELELKLGSEWQPVIIPTDPVEVRLVQQPNSGLMSQFMVRFDLVSDKEVIGNYTVNLQAHLYSDVWVAAAAIKPGTSLDTAPITRERRDVIRLTQPLFTSENRDPALCINEYLQPGAVILARSIHQKPIVFRGQFVQAAVIEKYMQIKVKAEVLEDGAPGQMIRVRTLSSRKEIRGKVVDEDTVQVMF